MADWFLGFLVISWPSGLLLDEDTMTHAKHKHLARTLEFDALLAGLEEAHSARAINGRSHPEFPDLMIWNYTNKCVYDKLWTPISVAARGLMTDTRKREVVATPFPKFFNVGEITEGKTLPNMPFEVFEKLDGSLIILFHYEGRWRASTRGAFGTEQALWAENLMADCDLSALDHGATYLCEAIYPENRIVIEYDEEALVLLSGYDREGYEFSADHISELAHRLGWRSAKRYQFENAAAMFSAAENLPETEEGYILRFEDGYRLKLKGSAYCRVHALISRVTPLAIWELMNEGEDLEAIRKQIPEEFWSDFDEIERIIQQQIDERIALVEDHRQRMESLTDKEVGLRLPGLPDQVRKLIFLARKGSGDLLQHPNARRILFRDVRPTLNQLEGYEPSFALSRSIGSGG